MHLATGHYYVTSKNLCYLDTAFVCSFVVVSLPPDKTPFAVMKLIIIIIIIIIGLHLATDILM
jgi:hypothetical protein